MKDPFIRTLGASFVSSSRSLADRCSSTHIGPILTKTSVAHVPERKSRGAAASRRGYSGNAAIGDRVFGSLLLTHCVECHRIRCCGRDQAEMHDPESNTSDRSNKILLLVRALVKASKTDTSAPAFSRTAFTRPQLCS